jgi:hypothetical protein
MLDPYLFDFGCPGKLSRGVISPGEFRWGAALASQHVVEIAGGNPLNDKGHRHPHLRSKSDEEAMASTSMDLRSFVGVLTWHRSTLVLYAPPV